jgi:hypothetical protein
MTRFQWILPILILLTPIIVVFSNSNYQVSYAQEVKSPSVKSVLQKAKKNIKKPPIRQVKAGGSRYINHK